MTNDVKEKIDFVGQIDDLPLIDVSKFIQGGTKRIVFGPGRFWDDYVMRCFTLKPGASVPENHHEWLHWAICLRGEGTFMVGEDEYPLSSGSWMHVPSNVTHTFTNTSKTDPLVILCIVPTEGDVNPIECEN